MSKLRNRRRRTLRSTPFRASHSPRFELLENRELLSLSIIVDTTSDAATTASNVLSLRLAIEVSNGTIPVSSLSAAQQALVSGSLAAPSPNLITFEMSTADPNYVAHSSAYLSGSGTWTISPTTPLPAITSPLFIDGYSERDTVSATAVITNNYLNIDALDNAVPMIQISGTSATPTAPSTTVDGLDIEAANSTVAGMIITNFSGNGITISGANTHGVGVYGSFIGTVPAPGSGYSAFVGLGTGNAGAGIEVTASNNWIGDDSVSQRNVIANNGIGVKIDTSTSSGTLVENSFILSNSLQGVLIESSNNTIGDSNGGMNFIGGNGEQGILISGSSGTDVQGNLVLGDQIGTFNDPTSLSSYAVLANGANYASGSLVDPAPSFAAGIDIEDSGANTIGGLLPAARNYIAGNNGDGVTINGSVLTANRLLNNWIGFDEYLINPTQVETDGKVFDFPNQNGVSITTSDNSIGSGTTNGQNVISNNRVNGILLTGSAATGNIISGNSVGLDPTGLIALGNADDGIDLENAPNNTIGGLTKAAANTVSANNRGIVLDGSGSTGNTIEGNQIGTGTDGATDLGNALNGVWINGASSNLIGGTATGSGNVISGNNVGVTISNATSPSSAATLNILQGNYIGTDVTGLLDVGNAIDGVYVTASNNTIGGTATGAGNTISHNGGVGVEIESGTEDAIRGNNMASNLGSIHNIGDGSTADAGGGIYLDPANNANGLMQSPTLVAAAPDSTGINTQATFTGAPNTTYSFDFFASPTGDPSGYGQGAQYLGSSNVTTNAAGVAMINADFVTASAIPSGDSISATATDPNGNTSAFNLTIPANPVGVQFATTTQSVNESQGTAIITVTRSGNTAGVVTIGYATAAITSTPGVDYTDTFGTLTFAAGVLTQTFPVQLLDPYKPLGSNTFKITLSNPTGGATIGTNATNTVTIIDNDAPNVSLSAPTYTVNQNGGSLTVTVTRNAGVGTTTVNYATSDGTAASNNAIAGVNYTATSGTLTFLPGVTTQTFTIPVLDDHLIHLPLEFNIALSSPTGANLAAPSTAVVTENDTDLIMYLSSSTYEVAQNGGGVVISVTRNDTSTVSTVTYGTSDGTAVAGVNYVATTGTLSFPIGVATQTFTVPVIDDDKLHNALKFNVSLLNLPTGGAIGTPSTAVVTEDDTDSQISFTADSFAGPQNGGSIIVSVTRTATTSISTVDYATSDGTAVAGKNYVSTSGMVTFPIGVATETIDIPVIDDNLIHSPALIFNITLSNPTGGGLVAHNEDVVTEQDTDPIIYLTSSTYSVNQNGGGVLVTVTRSDTTATSLVNYATSNGTAASNNAIAGVNYTAVSGTLSFGIGIANQSFTVPVIDDDLLHDALNFNVLLNTPLGGALGTPSSAVVTENDTDPQISFTANSFSGPDTGGTIAITVTRTGTTAISMVNYATSGGTAIPGTNYTTTMGTLTFPIGVATETINVPVVDDNQVHTPPLTFNISLSNPVGGGLVAQSTDVVTIESSTPEISFTTSNFSANQNASSVPITVTRTDTSVISQVNYSTSDGTAISGKNYTSTSGTLTFGVGVATQTFNVPLIDDHQIHGPLTFNLGLTNPISGTLIAPATAVVTENDTDTTLSLSAATYTVDQNAGGVVITVSRTDTTAAATVSYTTSNGTAHAGVNYTATSGTLPFAVGVASETFTVPVIDDGQTHGPLTFNVAISNPTGAALGSPSTAIVTETDSNATISFTNSMYSGNQNAGTISLMVTRSTSTNVSTVQYSTVNGTAIAGTNYVQTSGSLTFQVGVTTQTIMIPVIDDGLVHGPLTFSVALSNPTGGGLVSPSTAIVNEIDTDPGMSFTAASYSVAQNSGGGTATIAVIRNTSANISTVQYSTVNGTAIAGVNYQATSGSLTFPVGATSETLTVPLLSDNLVHGPLNFSINLSNPTGGGLAQPSTTTVSIIDQNSPGAFNLAQTALLTSPGWTSVTIPVNRTGGSAGTASVSYGTSPGTGAPGVNYAPVSGVLTFPPGVTLQNIVVPLLNTTQSGPDQTFNVLLTNPVQLGTLGTITSAQIQIQYPANSSGGGGSAGQAPTVTGTSINANAGGIDSVSFTFSQPMNASRAQNPASYGYFFLNGGRDATPVQSASYNAATQTATVVPSSPIPLGVVDQLIMNAPNLVAQGVGLTSAAGVYLAPNLAGSTAYEATFEAGRNVTYVDAVANIVSLKMSGPGTIAVELAPSGNDQEVGLSGTVPNHSTLTGQLKKTRRGGGVTPIPLITGAAGVKIKLPASHFEVGGISATAIDAMSVSGALKLRRRTTAI